MGGYCIVAVTPGNGFVFQYDSSGTVGQLESISQAGSTVYPCWLRLKRSGNQFSAYYAGSDKNWKQIGGAIVPQAVASASNICLFSTAHSMQKACGVEFANYNADFHEAKLCNIAGLVSQLLLGKSLDLPIRC